MRERLELLVNLWTFGAPVVLLTWAALRLTMRAPARARYLLAIGGFVATLAVPLAAPSMRREAAAADASLAVAVADPLAAPVAIAWAAVAALLLLREAAGHARLRRMRRAMPAAPEELKRRLEWPARVPLLVGEYPCTIGLFRPAVALPADLADRSIARHELAHARWRDPLLFALLRTAAAIFWVSPVWLVLRWVRREREAAADAAALHGTSGEEESYVAALLRCSRVRPARELTSAMAASDLEYRARRILAPQRASALALLALAGGAMLLRVATPARLDAEEPVVAVMPVRVIAETPEPVAMAIVIPAEAQPPPKRKPQRRPAPPPATVPRDVHVDVHVDVQRHVHIVRK